MKITLTLPEEMIKIKGITEDTLFITTYKDGQIHVEPYDEEDLAEVFPENDELNDDYDDDEMDEDIWQSWQVLLKEARVRDMKTDIPADSVMPTRDCLTTTTTAAEFSSSMIILQKCLAAPRADVKTDTNQ